MSWIRHSNFRHVFGRARKPDDCYENVKVTRTAWDSNYIACSEKYIGICWQSGGGGAFAVIPMENVGRVAADAPLYAGHSGAVLDVAFNPFASNVIASVAEDSTVRVWTVPEEAPTANITEADVVLYGHGRKVGTCNWHPSASNVLATSSTDLSIKVWDIEAQEEKLSFDGVFGDIIQSVDWGYDGNCLCATSKDKKARIIDIRSGSIAQEGEGHQGVKGTRCLWLGRKDRMVTVGFSKQTDRQFFVWDVKDMSAPLVKLNIDTSAGQLMPFYDEDTGMLYLAGKGDGNIRYYEMIDEKPWNYFLNEYKSNVPQRGMCVVPKTLLNVNDCEVCRMLKITAKNCVEPIEFKVPRKSEGFQADIYPETRSAEAALSAEQWFNGETSTPKLLSMKDFFVTPQMRAKGQSAPGKARSSSTAGPSPVELKTRIGELETENTELKAKVAELEEKLAAMA